MQDIAEIATLETGSGSHRWILSLRLTGTTPGLKGATLPAKVTQLSEFFVVGGPVQPDRACYVRRSADDDLLDCIGAERFASVLAPRATGKSSLMARTIRRLRADAQLAAVVDFNQIAPRGEQVDAARWHYSIAYRICRELRLKLDLQAWWHDKNLLLSEQRLVEFFHDVVLAHTEAPVTIFFDEAERAAELPYVSDLFAALHACYMRRVSEPDFARLNFVVLGAAAAAQLCPDNNVSPFVAGRSIRLEDFSLAECATFAPGLGQSAGAVDVVLARIHFWTHGQPYLTQKLARAVARRGGRVADVDSAVNELFLATGISREEPLLHHMRQTLTEPSPRRRQALSMIARIGRGQEVIDDPAAIAQRLLTLSGFISSDDNGMLRFRNRIVEQVFSQDPALKAEPVRWQRPAALGAAAVAAFLLLPYWYTQVLPQSAIETLAGATDYTELEAAYSRLARWPGFGGRANRLFGDALARNSRGASTLDQARLADAALRALPEGEERADELMAAYWLRRSQDAAARSDRDGALIFALAALEQGSAAAHATVADLVDGDYRQLVKSVHLTAPVQSAAVNWERDQLIVIDANQRVHRWQLEPAAIGPSRTGSSLSTLPSRLSALEHVGMTRGIFVDEPGNAGAFEFELVLEHQRTSDILVRLTAPSGASAEVELPARAGGLERFVHRATAANGLLSLAGESITGRWEVTLFDRLSGETGQLLSWGLRFAGVPQNWDDAPSAGLPLPDPVRTEQVRVSLSADGRYGVALPARPGARGAVTVWDLATGRAIADLPLADRAEGVALIGSDRLLVFGMRQATLWDLGAGAAIAEFSSSNGYLGRPAVSPDGGYFALAEAVGDEAVVSVFRAADGARHGRLSTGIWRDWVLGTEAAFIAGIDGSRRGRVFDLAGGLIAEFLHHDDLVRLVSEMPADRVVAVDAAGEIFAWPLAAGRVTLSPRDSIYLGRTGNIDSVSAAAGALAYADAARFVAVVDTADGRRRASLDHGEGSLLATYLDAEAERLVSLSGTRLRLWRLRDDAAPGPNFGAVATLAMGAAGELAVLGYRSGEVALMPALTASLATGTTLAAAAGHSGMVTSLTVSAGGSRVASGGSDGVVRLWDAQTGRREPNPLRHPAGPIDVLAFSRDDRWLVSGSPGLVRVFPLADGEVPTDIRISGRPQAVAIDAGNRTVAVGDSSGNIVLAALDGSTEALTFRADAPVTALDFAGDTGRLVSGSAAGTLVLWDTRAVPAAGTRISLAGSIRWAAFAPDDSTLFVVSGVWLHRLQRTAAGVAVQASSLLPAELREPASVAMTEAGDGVRLIAHAGGGRLGYGELKPAVDPGAGNAPAEAAPAGAAPAADAPAVMLRDWPGVLGLELDTSRGTLRRTGL